MEEKKAGGFIQDLTELMFYDECGTEKKYEELVEEEKVIRVKKTVNIFAHLDKLNMCVKPKVDETKVVVDEKKNLDTLTVIIATFLKKIKTTKPALFPCRELAHKILSPPVKKEGGAPAMEVKKDDK